jgi:hypothetical protein
MQQFKSSSHYLRRFQSNPSGNIERKQYAMLQETTPKLDWTKFGMKGGKKSHVTHLSDLRMTIKISALVNTRTARCTHLLQEFGCVPFCSPLRHRYSVTVSNVLSVFIRRWKIQTCSYTTFHAMTYPRSYSRWTVATKNNVGFHFSDCKNCIDYLMTLQSSWVLAAFSVS